MVFHGIQILKIEANKLIPDDNISNQSKALLTYLTNNQRLQYFIKEWRKPTKYINVTYPQNIFAKTLKELRTEQKRNRRMWQMFTYLYNLPPSFSFQMQLLFTYESFINFTDHNLPSIYFLSCEKDIREKLEETNRDEYIDTEDGEYYSQAPVQAIFIEQYLTKQQLIKWIKNNWEEIEPQLKKLTEIPFFNWKFKDSEISGKIVELHDKGHSLKEISDKLDEMYPDHKYVSDERWIDNKIKRYIQALNKIQKHFKQKSMQVIPVKSDPEF